MMQDTFTPSSGFLPGTATRLPQVALSEVPVQYRAVRLPCKNSPGLAAVFVLPDESYASVADAAGNITGRMVLNEAAWVPIEDTLKLSLPRFEVEGTLDLRPVRHRLPKSVGGCISADHQRLLASVWPSAAAVAAAAARVGNGRACIPYAWLCCQQSLLHRRPICAVYSTESHCAACSKP